MRLLVLALAIAATLAVGTERVFVANSGGDDLSIIDPGTNAVTGVLKVSKNPHGLVASPDRRRLYVSSEGEDVLDVIDCATLKRIHRVPLGARPNNLAITPDGGRVYVCIRGASWVDVVDTGSLRKVKSIPVGGSPHNVYCWPDGRWMIATSMAENKLTVIDVKAEAPAFAIPLPGIPRPLAIDARNRRLYVQLSELHGFVVVDFDGRRVVRTVRLPEAPAGARPLIPGTFSHGIAVAPDGDSVWVASMLDNSVSVFALPDLERRATIPVGKAPDWLTFSRDGARCYVSNAGSDSVSVIDVASRSELARIGVGRVPKRLIAVDLSAAPRPSPP